MMIVALCLLQTDRSTNVELENPYLFHLFRLPGLLFARNNESLSPFTADFYFMSETLLEAHNLRLTKIISECCDLFGPPPLLQDF